MDKFQFSRDHHMTDHFRKNFFSEILEIIRNTMQKTVCQYLVSVLRNLWQKLTTQKTLTKLTFSECFIFGGDLLLFVIIIASVGVSLK